MSPEERLEVLDAFAVQIGSAASKEWIDDRLIEALRAASEDPSKRDQHLRLAELFFAARELWLKRAAASAPASPQPPNAHVPPDLAAQAELIARDDLRGKINMETRLFDQAKAYEQIIIGLGYGAILALWATMSSKLPAREMLVCGSMIGASLLIYVVFHIAQLVWSSFWQLRVNQTFSSLPTYVERNRRWDEVQVERLAAMRWSLWAWMVLFPLQPFLGVGGALGLIFAAISALMP
jgi:hypothetical protein